MNSIKALKSLGQSIWLDFIDRTLITSGKLQNLIEDGLTGITSNPSIFEKAIVETNEYSASIEKVITRGDRDVLSIYEELAIKDIQDAADLLNPVYQRLNGSDGYVSMEVSPYLASNTLATIHEAKRLWRAINRPNVMIKVPATKEGIPAIRQLIADGLNINITLLFSVEVYEQVADAFLAGLEARQARGEDLTKSGSVASFFVSRIDTAVDKILEERIKCAKIPANNLNLINLLGKVAIANAKKAYEAYQKIYSSPRWKELSKHGARPQRLLWASTSTKSPKYRDVMYIEELIGPDTVNTIPTPTLVAFEDHGRAAVTLSKGISEAEETLEILRAEGIDLNAVTAQLLTEGIEKFTKPFDKLLTALEKTRVTQLGRKLNSFSYTLPTQLQDALAPSLNEWTKTGKYRSEWNRDASVWTRSGEEKWLGWLDIPNREMKRAKELQEFALEIRTAGYQHVVLLGMGGSSLGAEVLEKTFGLSGVKNGYPEFHILDSTDPAQIKELEQQLSSDNTLDHTLFIVSSKSGSTLEPNIFFDYFFERVKETDSEANTGKHFIAITDPGSSLEKIGKDRGFRKIFYGEPSIGGRYSVLSNFGMVPAALMGVDVQKLLAQTLTMVWSCSSNVPPSLNPGVLLGSILGTLGKNGRDKVTLICSREISHFGAWLEQLLAESTGKEEKGLIPIAGEQIVSPDLYGSDRVFAYIRLNSSNDRELDSQVHQLEKAGQPVIRISIPDLYNLGQEFFRWEIATSVAGSILGINPFDQPDVEASKVATRELTAQYETKGALPLEVPIFEDKDFQIFDDPENAAALKKQLGAHPTVSDYLRAHLNRIHPGDYFAILAYLPMNPQDDDTLQGLRTKILKSKKVATCVEFGPRFLHSTGQAYKGGPNSGVFLQITTHDLTDLPVPGHRYTFGVVKAAEARGDFNVLTQRHRRAMRVHLRQNPKVGLDILRQEIEKAVA